MRDGVRGPVDLGIARTKAERRRLNFEHRIVLETKKERYQRYRSFLFRARDGDRTRDPLLGKEVLHR